jgi:hypothetical protein
MNKPTKPTPKQKQDKRPSTTPAPRPLHEVLQGLDACSDAGLLRLVAIR